MAMGDGSVGIGEMGSTPSGEKRGVCLHAGDHHRPPTTDTQLPGAGVLGGLSRHASRGVRSIPETGQGGAAFHGAYAEMNYEAANFIRKQGVQRVVLAGHVSIDETRHMETI